MRIYLDTNILIRERWPEISVRLRGMLNLTRVLQVSVVLPEAVEREIEAHWFRELKNELTSFKNAESRFHRVLNTVATDSHIFLLSGPVDFYYDSPLDESTMEGNYTAKVEELKKEWRVTSAPLSPVELDKLFHMAISHEPPFSEEGKGFQDAVILLSVLDDLSHFPDTTGALLTADKDLDCQQIRDLIARFSVDLKVSNSVDKFLEFLKLHLEEYLRRDWDQDEKSAAAELYRQKKTIEEFICTGLNREPELLAPFIDYYKGVPQEVPRVIGVEVLEPTAPFTPPPQPGPGRDESQSVRIAAAMPALVRVAFPHESLMSLGGRKEVKVLIEIEAEATRANGRYTISKLLRAKPVFEPEI